MVRDRNYLDAVSEHPINNTERKIAEKEAPILGVDPRPADASEPEG